uniref:Phosphatidylinositol-glycan-specific phospholipase D n=1 Tax=Jaculus jaculus TaxID=51337 RepID=A0A8C5L0V2_JACJA
MSAFGLSSGLWLLLAFSCPGGLACGLSTHVEIGHRALEFLRLEDGRVNYRKLLLEHQDAYQAGTVFPDSFYPSICKGGKFHDVSERTHWTPFLNASIHYIRENYPLPWEKDTEKLVAFLFGITSHMVADISWHSLGIEQGFLRTMGAIDFQGSYSEAHSAGDFGGDVLSQFEFDYNYLSRHWYVPIKDLLGIYEKLYGRSVITKKLYSTYSTKSPFLVEQFQEYFLGGLDDMAFWSTNIYRVTSFMLENGISDCDLPENPLFIACGGQRNHSLSSKVQKNDFHRNLTASLSQDTRKNVNYTERGVFYSVSSWTPVRASAALGEDCAISPRAFAGCSPWVGSQSSSVSGWPQTHSDLESERPLCPSEGVGHPGRDPALPQPSGRLGSALAVLDFNQDGQPDLAVGAPSTGSEQLTYKVRLLVVVGGGSRGPGRDDQCWTLLPAHGSGAFEHDWVWCLSISSTTPLETLTVETADWTVRGEEDFAWFGYSLHGVVTEHRGSLLLVGSPTWRNSSRAGRAPRGPRGSSSLGRVYGFFPPACRSEFAISGDKAMAKLGTALSSGQVMLNGTVTRVLLVGAPTHDDVSKMAFLTMTLHQGGTTRMYQLAPNYTQPALLSTFSGDRRFSRFGGALHLSDLDQDGLDEIIVAAPLRITDVTSGLFGGEDGRVYVYNGKQSTIGDMTGKCKSWITPCPEEKYVLQASSRFGSSLISVRSKEMNQVVVAAGRSSLGARLSGALHIYSLGSD